MLYLCSYMNNGIYTMIVGLLASRQPDGLRDHWSAFPPPTAVSLPFDSTSRSRLAKFGHRWYDHMGYCPSPILQDPLSIHEVLGLLALCLQRFLPGSGALSLSWQSSSP